MMSSASRGSCCIAGGGPAGMMLGYLLARAGIDVLVLEKHADFLRDFRGDTVHPSTLELMNELGVLDQLLKLPHQRIPKIRVRIGGDEFVMSDMTRVRTRCRFMVLMPQWDFLNFLVAQGNRYPTFHLKMQTEVTGLIEEEGQIVGVRATAPEGAIEIRADLVVAADGRSSVLREIVGLTVQEVGAPIDVLWMRLSKHRDDPEFLIHANSGKAVVLLDRGEYWQCGLTIPKGTASEMQAKGIEELRASIVANAPFLRDRVAEVRGWNDVKLLKVKVDRLRRWYRPGLVCIGDAAHAMSPVAGVGINIAIQDAVAAANILAGPLGEGTLHTGHLAKIQRRRGFPAGITQRVQALIRNQIGASQRLPWLVRLLEATTLPRRMRTRFVSVGIRPEHVKTPDVFKVRSFGGGFTAVVPARQEDK
jgi:2-polyprenyl-6-methoxyphenol hydroxylase-like FAD-dependent oxidoreductase